MYVAQNVITMFTTPSTRLYLSLINPTQSPHPTDLVTPGHQVFRAVSSRQVLDNSCVRTVCPSHSCHTTGLPRPSSFHNNIVNDKEPGSSGSIVSDYGPDDRGSIPGGDKGFFL
jgi:hypothetical protein